MADLSLPPPDLHSPKELLAVAEELLNAGDSRLYRAAILEAITALEAYVADRVFSSLGSKIDPLLVKWLEEKTRMDFDSRLDTFVPIAIGRTIDKQNHLWAQYKEAKEIRNKVTHSGRKVTREQAFSVVRTVLDWLAYLGSTVEVDLALIDLRRHLQQKGWGEEGKQKGKFSPEITLVEIVQEYFQSARSADVKSEFLIGGKYRADLVLFFEQYSVLVETKVLRGSRFESGLQSAVTQISRMMTESRISRAAIIIGSRDVPKEYEKPQQLMDGQISVIGISI